MGALKEKYVQRNVALVKANIFTFVKHHKSISAERRWVCMIASFSEKLRIVGICFKGGMILECENI